MGAKKRPFYRIVAAEHSSPRDGRFIEVVGHYDPLTEPATVEVKADRVQHWLSVGAKPSPTVEGLLKRAGVIDASKNYNKPKGQPAAAETEATA
jgi:small subunit ribosomal protein S16